MPNKVNIIVDVKCDYDEDTKKLHESVRTAAEDNLNGKGIIEHFEGELAIAFGEVQDVWVQSHTGGPFPTMKQGDAVKALREQYGREDDILFSPNAYEGTHLSAYGLVEMKWHSGIYALDPRRIMIRPDGERATFESVSV